MANKRKPRILVIGGGLGGLWATLTVASRGIPVTLFSLFEVKRSHSACAQGGINAVLDTKGEYDSVEQHIRDTIKGGAYLANQPPIKSMCESAPGLIRTFERMGVTFSRTPEGLLDLRLFGGVKHRRTCFAGASTGQQLLYSVDEQVRRLECEGMVEKHEWWEFLALVRDDDGRVRGITAMDLRSLEVKSFAADAVILASGGLGLVYNRSTNSANSTGAAASRVYQQGARFANAEFIQFHPTAMLGDDKLRLMSEAARGDGGRIWVPKQAGDARPANRIPESQRFYFLEEWYPSYGNTVPRDVASRAIFKAVHQMGLGVGGEEQVYLDLTHLDKGEVRKRLGAILDIYRKFRGVDPVEAPMLIYPAPHYAMGGLWVDYAKAGDGGIEPIHPRNHATSIPGLYACGECDYGYHGANRLGANSLLSTSFSGKVTGEAAVAFVANGLLGEADEALLRGEADRQRRINEGLLKSEGDESPYALHKALGRIMSDKVAVVRDNAGLRQALEGLADLEARFGNIGLADRQLHANQALPYARQLHEMIVLAQAIARSALARNECRGSHYKPEFELPMPENRDPQSPEYLAYLEKWRANNDEWIRTTLAEYRPGQPEISFEAVDTSVMPPEEPRDYR